jgi:hypothetical protein
MEFRRVSYSLGILTLLSGAGQDVTAQAIAWSQHGSVTQRIGETVVTIQYNRPVARGRELFGGIVNWGRIWTPGADSATTIAFSDDVILHGHRVPAGKYSIWMIPQQGDWTFILSAVADVFHTRYPSGRDVLRFAVTPERGGHFETLTFHFPVVDGPKAVLAFQWGETKIEIPLEIVLESRPSTLPL